MKAGRSVSESVVGLPELQTGLRSGSLWFYLIGALALVYTLILVLGANFSVIGLGVTARMAEQAGSAHMGRVIIFNCWAAALFMLFGLFAERSERWASVGGVILYSLDGLLMLYSHNYLGAALHGILLYGIFHGMALPSPATQSLRRAEPARKAA
jgi:hypothetical protein